MRKFIRNDYTFVTRLQRLADEKLEQEKNISIFDKKLAPVFRIHMKIEKWIDDIKEDMQLKLSQRLSDSINKNNHENILNIQTEMSLLWFIDNK
jgi:hypothetical protein